MTHFGKLRAVVAYVKQDWLFLTTLLIISTVLWFVSLAVPNWLLENIDHVPYWVLKKYFYLALALKENPFGGYAIAIGILLLLFLVPTILWILVQVLLDSILSSKDSAGLPKSTYIILLTLSGFGFIELPTKILLKTGFVGLVWPGGVGSLVNDPALTSWALIAPLLIPTAIYTLWLWLSGRNN